MSVRLVNNIEDCTIKNCEAKCIFHYKRMKQKFFKLKMSTFVKPTTKKVSLFLFQDQYDNIAAHTQKGIEFLEKYGHFVDQVTIL